MAKAFIPDRINLEMLYCYITEHAGVSRHYNLNNVLETSCKYTAESPVGMNDLKLI